MADQGATQDPGFDEDRRQVLRFAGVAGLAAAGLATGLPLPARAAAAMPVWPKDAFAQKDEKDALQVLYGKDVSPSDKIALDVPEIAENGAVVPVSLTTSIANVTSIAILVPDNPFTLAAAFHMPEETEASIGCRIKMGKTSNVVAVVEADGKLYSTSKEVKVTLGGCGG